MIKSMTGYGRASKSFDGFEVTAEVRSVNNRYLDCNVKLPRSFSFAEDKIKQRVKEVVARGKVDILFNVASIGGNSVEVTLNRPIVEGYLAAFQMMADTFRLENDIKVSNLAAMPDVFLVERPEVDEEAVLSHFLEVLDVALEQYDGMRAVEGQAIVRDLLGKGEILAELVGQVESRSAVTVAEYRSRLYGKLREVLESASIDESRILTEAAIFADKIAVDEETVRLRSHLAQMNDMLAKGGTVGRKLDFLLQEMNREANTIGSKGNDLAQAQTVVEINAMLEKIREQIQNIE